MNEQEIATILNIPYDKVFNLCQDRNLLLALLVLAYHKGIQCGLKDAHDGLNQVLHSYQSSLITN